MTTPDAPKAPASAASDPVLSGDMIEALRDEVAFLGSEVDASVERNRTLIADRQRLAASLEAAERRIEAALDALYIADGEFGPAAHLASEVRAALSGDGEPAEVVAPPANPTEQNNPEG